MKWKQAVLAGLFILLMVCPAFAGSLLPYPKFKAFDTSGNLLNGGKVYTYITGTTTEKSSYSDEACSTANANPVVLDANGEATIYLNGTYRIVLKTSADVTLWTMDGVTGLTGYGREIYFADAAEGDHGVTGNGATIKAHVDTAGSINSTIVMRHSSVLSATTTTYTLDTNLTVPSTITLKFEKGARVSVNAGKTLTVNGQVICEEDVCFAGAGTVAGALLNTFKMADWFTGVTDSTTVTGVLKDLGASNAQGDVFYRNATQVTRLGAGTAGQFLRTGGAAANPTFAAPPTLRDKHNNLIISCASATAATVTSDASILLDSNAIPYRATSVNVTADITTAGDRPTLNGLDSGVEASSTWYYIWVIYNGTTVSSLLSTSTTSPSLPTGYTYKTLVGAVYNNSSSDFVQFYQIMDSVQYLAPIKIADNGGSTSTAALTIDTNVPPTLAKGVFGKVMSNTGGLTFFYDRATFANTLNVDNTVVPFSVTFGAATETAAWSLPVLLGTVSSMYYQVSANTVDIWISGCTLR